MSTRESNVIAVGVFDGVHRGHMQILERAHKLADENNVSSAVVTFEPHPDAVLGKSKPRPPLTPIGEKRELLGRAGAMRVEILHFDRNMATLQPETFVRRYLIDQLGMVHLVAGVDFALGKNRVGTMEYLRDIGSRWGFGVEAVPLLLDPDGPVSSSRIRDFLAQGNVSKAAKMLGRWYRLEAQVVSGRGLGKDLGFPTANLELLEHQAMPADGIYAVWVQTEDGARHRGALSIGFRPAVGGGPRTVEVHLLDFEGDLRGRTLCIEFVEWLREERDFPDLAALAQAIGEDVTRARSLLEAGQPGAATSASSSPGDPS